MTLAEVAIIRPVPIYVYANIYIYIFIYTHIIYKTYLMIFWRNNSPE